MVDESNTSVHHKQYHYGYNASYSRKLAKMAENAQRDARKYKWHSIPSLKPFTGDIINKLCTKYGINKADIEYRQGRNTFTGDNVGDTAVQQFIDDYVNASRNIRASEEEGDWKKFRSKYVPDPNDRRFQVPCVIYQNTTTGQNICMLEPGKPNPNPDKAQYSTYDVADMLDWFADYNGEYDVNRSPHRKQLGLGPDSVNAAEEVDRMREIRCGPSCADHGALWASIMV